MPIPGFGGAALLQTAFLDGNSKTDSYDSALGPYNPSKPGTLGSVTTPGITPGLVQMKGSSTVRGTTFVGPGGKVGPPAPPTPTFNSDLVVWKDWNCSSLAETNLKVVPVLPDVVVPTLSGPGTDLTVDFRGASPAPGRYGKVTVGGGGVLTLAAGTYVFREFSVSGGGSIAVPSGTCSLFVTGALSLTSGPMGANSSPGRLAVQLPAGAPEVQLVQGVRTFMTFYAPSVDFKLSGDAQVFGALVCRTLRMEGGSFIHFDEALLR